jgi:hypothetical protein
MADTNGVVEVGEGEPRVVRTHEQIAAARRQLAWDMAAEMSAAPPSGVQTSLRESAPKIGFFLTGLAVVLALVLVVRMVIFEPPGTTLTRLFASRPMPTATVVPAVAVTAVAPVVLLVPTQTPFVVTATPTYTPVPTVTPVYLYEVQRIQIPVEVTRIVEVAAAVPATVTPVPLAPGTVRICIDAAGVRELYIGGVGVVGGGCRTFQVGVGASYIEIQVNR